jgi:hypothetical protein
VLSIGGYEDDYMVAASCIWAKMLRPSTRAMLALLMMRTFGLSNTI